MKRVLVMAGILALVGLFPVKSDAGPPPAFTLSPADVTFSTAVDSIEYQNVTVTTGHKPVVISAPSTLTGDVGPRADGGMIFWDTQTGTCWQQYESQGHPIPAHTSCTIQVGFHPDAVKTFNASLTVNHCSQWTTDPTWGFIVCTAFDASESVALAGNGT